METYFDFAVDRFRRPQSTWVNRSLRLAFKVVLNFLEAHRVSPAFKDCWQRSHTRETRIYRFEMANPSKDGRGRVVVSVQFCVEIFARNCFT